MQTGHLVVRCWEEPADAPSEEAPQTKESTTPPHSGSFRRDTLGEPRRVRLFFEVEDTGTGKALFWLCILFKITSPIPRSCVCELLTTLLIGYSSLLRGDLLVYAPELGSLKFFLRAVGEAFDIAVLEVPTCSIFCFGAFEASFERRAHLSLRRTEDVYNLRVNSSGCVRNAV